MAADLPPTTAAAHLAVEVQADATHPRHPVLTVSDPALLAVNGHAVLDVADEAKLALHAEA